MVEPIYYQCDRYDPSKTLKRLRKALNDSGEFDEPLR